MTCEGSNASKYRLFWTVLYLFNQYFQAICFAEKDYLTNSADPIVWPQNVVSHEGRHSLLRSMGCNTTLWFILYFSGGANLELSGFNMHCIHHARLTYFIGNIKVSKVSIRVKR